MSDTLQQTAYYDQLAETALSGRMLNDEKARQVLLDPAVDLLPLVHAAYRVRRRFWGRRVQVHILNNAQNGYCPEDCGYCSQARSSEADIETYPPKEAEEILAEAQRAYESGAHRYCLVFAGRGPSRSRTKQLAEIVGRIKRAFPSLEVCVSAGLMDEEKTDLLAEAGVDRLNHNLNTSRGHYPNICTTHTYDDRLATIRAARRSGLGVCSGMIVGMGETPEEVIEVARTLRELNAESIPVNFLLPFEGNRVSEPGGLNPSYNLRVLCLFRFMNPEAEVRIAAGREAHFRSLEAMTLYPANSLFLGGYLNSLGGPAARTLQMIRDAGFEIESDADLSELLARIDRPPQREELIQLNVRKGEAELRPVRASGGES